MNLSCWKTPLLSAATVWSTAYALAAAIKKVGQFDLIFCGRQAADSDSGQVGACIAEILGLPQVTVAKKIEAVDGKVKVDKVTTNGYEVVEVPTPALITISNELGEVRFCHLQGYYGLQEKRTYHLEACRYWR